MPLGGADYLRVIVLGYLQSKPDVIQILTIIISVAGTLASVITTYFITSKIEAKKYAQQLEAETRRWEKEKADKRQQYKREALEIILEWVEPIREAVWRISLLIEEYQTGEITEQIFIDRCPDPSDNLKALPPHHKAFLPKQMQQQLRYMQVALGGVKWVATLKDESAST